MEKKRWKKDQERKKIGKEDKKGIQIVTWGSDKEDDDEADVNLTLLESDEEEENKMEIDGENEEDETNEEEEEEDEEMSEDDEDCTKAQEHEGIKRLKRFLKIHSMSLEKYKIREE